MKKRGFTLVELLAVIVLLGLVSLIAFPRILEMMNQVTGKTEGSKQRLLYQATDRYLDDNKNAYPLEEGNTYCISTDRLEQGEYLQYEDLPDKADENVVRARVNGEEKLDFGWVNRYECIEKGVVNANLGDIDCEILTNGYAIEKEVEVQFPVGGDYEYSYSLDNGKSWKKYSDDERLGVANFQLQKNGYFIMRFKSNEELGYRSCTASIVQIDKTPIGGIVAFGGSDIPKGYLEANGQEVMRKTYKKLYDKIKSVYGSGDGSTSFNLPDLKGKVLVGYDSSQTEFNGMGKTGGEKIHKLEEKEMASHTHAFTGTTHSHTFTGAAHTHTFTGTAHSHTFTGTSHTHTLTGTEHTHTFTGKSVTTRKGS